MNPCERLSTSANVYEHSFTFMNVHKPILRKGILSFSNIEDCLKSILFFVYISSGIVYKN